jgi:hypothetical protein
MAVDEAIRKFKGKVISQQCIPPNQEIWYKNL